MHGRRGGRLTQPARGESGRGAVQGQQEGRVSSREAVEASQRRVTRADKQPTWWQADAASSRDRGGGQCRASRGDV